MTGPCRFESAAPDGAYVYGACAPGRDQLTCSTVEDWIEVMQSQGIKRVLCLLSESQLRQFNNLLDQYQSAFGTDRVFHVPVTDHTLMDRSTLHEEIIPILEVAVNADEPIVVHCLAGIGRTGQALAGWLVAQHGYSPTEAITTVKRRGRQPDDAVRAGRATHEELQTLLQSVK